MNTIPSTRDFFAWGHSPAPPPQARPQSSLFGYAAAFVLGIAAATAVSLIAQSVQDGRFPP